MYERATRMLLAARHSCLWRRAWMAPNNRKHTHMRALIVLAIAALVTHTMVIAQHSNAQLPPAIDDDPVAVLVSRLDLERYKSTIKGLTQFGDRRQGTDRNRAANDWIEAQLKSVGCTNAERV